MRIVALVCGLCAPLAFAEGDLSLSERSQRLAAAASLAAAELQRGDGYAALMQPMPRAVLQTGNMAGTVFFGAGWGRLEPWGSWSIGDKSSLHLRVNPENPPQALYLNGRYFQGPEPSRVLVNGVLVNEAALKQRWIDLPHRLVAGGTLDIVIEHINPMSPHDVDPARGDTRKLKFGITELGMR